MGWPGYFDADWRVEVVTTQSIYIEGRGDNLEAAKADAAKKVREMVKDGEQVFLHMSDMPRTVAWRLQDVTASRVEAREMNGQVRGLEVTADCTFEYIVGER